MGYQNFKPHLGSRPYKGHRLSRGLVCFPICNEGSGNEVFDLSGNGRTGTFVADTHFVPGKFGLAVDFDGAGDLISIPAMTDLPNGLYTIVVWMKSSADGPQTFFSVGNTGTATQFVSLDMGGGEGVQFYHRDDGNTLANNSGALPLINDGVWHQIVAVRSASDTFGAYVDGQHAKTVTQSIGVTTINTTQIGALVRNSTLQLVTGQVDHVLVYNRALSAFEIALLYKKPFCIFERPGELAIFGGYEAPVGDNVPVKMRTYRNFRVA